MTNAIFMLAIGIALGISLTKLIDSDLMKVQEVPLPPTLIVTEPAVGPRKWNIRFAVKSQDSYRIEEWTADNLKLVNVDYVYQGAR